MTKKESKWLLIKGSEVHLTNITLQPEILTFPMFFETLLWTGESFPLFAFHKERIQKICTQLTHKRKEIEISLQTLLFTMQEYYSQTPKKVNLYFFSPNISLFPFILVRVSELSKTHITHLKYIPFLYTFSSHFSGLKSINCLIYLHWRNQYCKHLWEDLILLSPTGKVSETAIANLWWSDGNKFYTPPLSEGCVDGTCRKALFSFLQTHGHPISEKTFSLNELSNVKMIWLTNALRGIQIVSHIIMGETILWQCKSHSNTIQIPLNQFHQLYFKEEIS